MYDAALCAPLAAERFGLEVLAEDVGDNAAAVTRFVLVQRPGVVPEPTGADKTTLVVYQADDHPGGLLEMLEQFATRGINLSRIESRPSGQVAVLRFEQGTPDIFDLPAVVTLNYADGRAKDVTVIINDRTVEFAEPLDGALRSAAISKRDVSLVDYR